MCGLQVSWVMLQGEGGASRKFLRCSPPNAPRSVTGGRLSRPPGAAAEADPHHPCMWLVELAFSSLSSWSGPGAAWLTQPRLTFAAICRPL